MKLIMFNGADSSLAVAFASSAAIAAGDKFSQIFNLGTGADASSLFMPVCPSDGLIVQPLNADLSANTYLGVVLP